MSLTRLNQAGLFVAFFSAVWGQTGVATVAWSSTVGEATHPTDAVATVAGARTLDGTQQSDTGADFSNTSRDEKITSNSSGRCQIILIIWIFF